ncbi:N-acetyltransferase [Nakamurella silvestris]|nr:N-acetyltransferase [Nakamurella silvestris]
MPINLPFVFRSPVPTERLYLRLMVEDDVDAVHSYMSRADVCEYLLFTPRDREEVAAKVAEFAAHTTLAADRDYLELAVIRRDDERLLGHVYFALESVEHETAEIGWTLHPDHHGQGYASEAADAVLGMAFEVLGLHRVVAKLDPRNDASVALCLRLGLRHEAHHVQDMMFKGSWADTGVYAILADEWSARHR